MPQNSQGVLTRRRTERYMSVRSAVKVDLFTEHGCRLRQKLYTLVDPRVCKRERERERERKLYSNNAAVQCQYAELIVRRRTLNKNLEKKIFTLSVWHCFSCTQLDLSVARRPTFQGPPRTLQTHIEHSRDNIVDGRVCCDCDV